MQMPQQFTRNTTPIANASDQATSKTKDGNLESDRPTPETDAAAWTETNWANAIVLANFARKLERERDEAREQRDRMAEILRDILAFNKGEKPHDYWALQNQTQTNAMAFDAWQEILRKIEQALETKP